MPHFTITRRISLSAQNIFDVIADVASYKDFLPLVERSTVRPQFEDGEKRRFSADLIVAYHPLRISEHFASQVEADRLGLWIKSISTGQALKRLVSSWVVKPVGDSQTDVVFTVDYEIKGFILQTAMSALFDPAVRKILTAFEDRARKLQASPAIAT